MAPQAESHAAASGERTGSSAATVKGQIDSAILRIDALISAQLDAVLHHPRLQALEGRWRGLRWLADQIEDGPGDRVEIRLLSVRWSEIERDMDRAREFDQSFLFRKIYEEQFGQAGGEPFGLLLLDRYVRHRPDDRRDDKRDSDRAVEDGLVDDKSVLAHLSQIASAAFAPVIVGADPRLLGVGEFADLAAARMPASTLDRAATGAATAPDQPRRRQDEYFRWRELSDRIDEHGDPRFLGIVLPRVLARLPWRDDGTRDDGFHYRESASTVADRVWMNGAYAFASVVARSAARFGWPADVRGTDPDRIGGGLVADVPQNPHRLSQTMALPRLPLEVTFTDRQERNLIEAGLMPIGALPHTDALLFGAVRSLYRPSRVEGPGGAQPFADSRVVTQMNALLCACRFAHHLKLKGRQTLGRIRQPEAVEAELRTWLSAYINRNTLAAMDTRAKHPLYDAQVRVTESRAKPGVFDCAIDLQPYFQLDNVTASFNFATELVPPRA